ncbi:hypothetical protein [Azospirillum sp. Sh1]|uniref:hypothetical protein n=1 Tax=Azospirillum sp. Sh1 TaxID=2607285 RepID=UPI00165EA910|nr:hypothetical protein [Azospirillum sp. Sh1]
MSLADVVDELFDEDVDFVEVVDVVALTESTSIAFSTQSRPVRGIRAGFRGGSGRWHFGMGGRLAPPRSFYGYPRNGRRKLARILPKKCGRYKKGPRRDMAAVCRRGPEPA